MFKIWEMGTIKVLYGTALTMYSHEKKFKIILFIFILLFNNFKYYYNITIKIFNFFLNLCV